jgi:hypothetical protein
MPAAVLPFVTSPLVYYTGDTRPLIELQLVYDDGSGPIDLTNATVTLTLISTTITSTGVLDQPVTVIDPDNAIVQYRLPYGLALPVGVNEGEFTLQCRVNYGNGDTQSTSTLAVLVRKRVGQA